MEIQRYQPGQVEQRSLASSNPTADANSFGAANGAMLSEAGKQLNSIATDWTVDLAKGSAKEAYNKATIEFNQATNEIFGANQGDKLGEIPKLVEAKRAEISSKYSTGLGPMSSGLFNGAFNDYYSATRKQVDDQVFSSAKKYQMAQSQALVENLTQQAAMRTDPNDVAKDWLAVRAEVISQNKNQSPQLVEGALRATQDDFYATRVLMQGQTSAISALGELEAQKGQLSAQRYAQLYEKYAPAAAQEEVNIKTSGIIALNLSDEETIAAANQFGPAVQKSVFDAVAIRQKNRDAATGAGIKAVLDNALANPDVPITPGLLSGVETVAIEQIRVNKKLNTPSSPSVVQSLKGIVFAQDERWRDLPARMNDPENRDKISAKDGAEIMSYYTRRLRNESLEADIQKNLTDSQIEQTIKKQGVSNADYDKSFAPAYFQAVKDFSLSQGREPTQEEKLKIGQRLMIQVRNPNGGWGKPPLYKVYSDKKVLPSIPIGSIPPLDQKAARLAIWNNLSADKQDIFKTPEGIPNEDVEAYYGVHLYKNLAF